MCTKPALTHAYTPTTMSNPARAPRETVSGPTLDAVPDAHPMFLRSEIWAGKKVQAKNAEHVAMKLGELDMECRPSIIIPKDHTVEPKAFQSAKPFFAVAKKGTMVPRVRSGIARDVLRSIWSVLPEEKKVVIRENMTSTIFVDGGAENTIGRLIKAYPHKSRDGGPAVPPIKPPTFREAMQALVHSGGSLKGLPPHAYRAYPLMPVEGQRAVLINPKSSNGFPVMGKGGDVDAMAKVWPLAIMVRKEIVEALLTSPNGVWEWLRKAEIERPWLVALMGKMKGDYYPAEKVEGFRARFYNTFGRQIMLNLQLATQPFEACKQSLLTNPAVRTCAGTTLVRGGAAKIVRALQDQLDEYGYAVTTMGDDSWVIIQWTDPETGDMHILMFALDGSSFDLTQHRNVMRPIHEVLRRELASIDKAAADLWYSLARERLVVVALMDTRKVLHGGPSGFPLQSLCNDMAEEILCERAIQDLVSRLVTERPSEFLVNDVIETQGSMMGFSMRVEQYSDTVANSLAEALEKVEFTFIGYNFYREHGEVKVYCDLPRQMSQLPYPGIKWMDKGQNFEVMEAMRLGSTILNWGIPPEPLQPAFKAAREHCIRLLEVAIERYGDSQDEKLKWAVSESPFGEATIPSLSGLRNALLRTPEHLWLSPVEELASRSALVSREDWGMMMADEAEDLFDRLNIPKPPEPEPHPPAAAVLTGDALPRRPTHKATAKNQGRPPPTVVWGPDKPKQGGSRMHERAEQAYGRLSAALPGDIQQDLTYEAQYGYGDGSEADEYTSQGSVVSATQSEAEEYYANRWRLE